MTDSEMVQKLFYFEHQSHILHWQTFKYSEHMALDKLYSAFQGFTDEFVEKYMGRNKRIDFKDVSMSFLNYQNVSPMMLTDSITLFLTTELDEFIAGDTDLLNMRDDLLGITKQVKYLLTLG